MAVRDSAAVLWDRQWGQPGALRLDVQQSLYRQSVPVPVVSFVASPGPPRIEWIAGEERPSPDLESCLSSFTRLADGPSDDALAEFAADWGPLGICQHGRPSTHAYGACAPLGSHDRYWEHHTERSAWSMDWWKGPGEIPPQAWRGKYWEPLVAYRFYVRQIAAAIRLVAALQSGRPTRTDDWALVVSGLDGKLTDDELAAREWAPPLEARTHGDRCQRHSLEHQRELLCRRVNQWLADAGVYPSLGWEPEGASLNLALGKPLVAEGTLMSKYVWHGATLYGMLVAQLAAVVAANGELTTCSWCRQPYKPWRIPRPDRRHFCSPKCRQEAHRVIDANYQRRKRATSKG